MKFSVVTPAWNVGPWLDETINSVLSQKGDFEIEYIVVTDPSNDNTIEIVDHYEKLIVERKYPIQCKNIVFKHIKLNGSGSMFAALNMGFAECGGDIYSWIAGDDFYKQGAFDGMSKVFMKHPEVNWLKGYGGIVNEKSEIINPGKNFLYHKDWLVSGIYGMESYHVNQDSVFWRAHLWKKCGPFPTWIKSTGDYWLWLQFAKYDKLWSANILVSFFRKRPGQESRMQIARCKVEKRRSRGEKRPLSGWIASLFFVPYHRIFKSPKVRNLLEKMYPLIFRGQSLEFFELNSGDVEIKRARTFVFK